MPQAPPEGHGPSKLSHFASRTRDALLPIAGDVNDGQHAAMPPSESALSISDSRRRLGLATLLLVLFLTFMDNTVISVTLANVQTLLHTGISQLQWVINGYALVFASFMLIFGTLGDQFGRKRVMLAGVILFCGGSVVAAVAPTSNVLVAGRVIMGLGAAASEPGTLSMIRHLYPERRSARQGARPMGWRFRSCSRDGTVDRWRAGRPCTRSAQCSGSTCSSDWSR